MVTIKQNVQKTGDRAFQVNLEIIMQDGSTYKTYEQVYEKTNPVFPAYKSIYKVLPNLFRNDLRSIHLITNSDPLFRELNGKPNENGSLYDILMEKFEIYQIQKVTTEFQN